jgi:hypothetical protein
MTERCPRCGDTRLSFNAGAIWQYGLIRWDEGELFKCAGCGIEGNSADLVTEETDD